MLRRLELIQLERVKSMMRYCPPNGTEGLARSLVRGSSRVPLPPASSTDFLSMTIAIALGGLGGLATVRLGGLDVGLSMPVGVLLGIAYLPAAKQ